MVNIISRGSVKDIDINIIYDSNKRPIKFEISRGGKDDSAFIAAACSCANLFWDAV